MLRVLSLFSGIGAFEVALNEENIEWELDHYCEIDDHATKSYNQIHNVTDGDNLMDVTDIDYSRIGDIDLITYGFPCQDISLAGKQKGFHDDEGNLTRSGLFFNAAEVIEKTKPKFAIFENVKNLTGKKFKTEFEAVLSTLDEIGYNTYWQVLNAKDYGIPQNRERVFGISIRKDIDRGYTFPEKQELKLRLKDMLESVVDEKFYLSEDKINKIATSNFQQEKKMIQTGDVCSTLLARDYKDPKCVKVLEPNGIVKTIRTSGRESLDGHSWDIVLEPRLKQVGQLYGTEKEPNPQAGRIYDPEGLSPTMDSCSGGNRMPKIMVKEATKKGYVEAEIGDSINLENPSSRKAGEPTEQRLEVNAKGLANTLTTVQKDNYVLEPYYISEKGCKYILSPKRGMCTDINEDIVQPLTAKGQQNWTESFVSDDIDHIERSKTIGGIEPTKIHMKNGDTIDYDGNNEIPSFRIRKLTPRECWRLMGFGDKYFDRVKAVSNTQLYKQAGNSIVVDVLRAIFRELKNQYPEYFETIWGEDL